MRAIGRRELSKLAVVRFLVSSWNSKNNDNIKYKINGTINDTINLNENSEKIEVSLFYEKTRT
jgi:hypothetical protein